jgi:hypothetical protein
MKVANRNSAQWLNYWWHNDPRAPKNLFMILFRIWFVLLLCRLLRRHLGELVFVMERNPSCSMKALHELCESRFYNEIGKKISREQRDEDWRCIYDAG